MNWKQKKRKLKKEMAEMLSILETRRIYNVSFVNSEGLMTTRPQIAKKWYKKQIVFELFFTNEKSSKEKKSEELILSITRIDHVWYFVSTNAIYSYWTD